MGFIILFVTVHYRVDPNVYERTALVAKTGHAHVSSLDQNYATQEARFKAGGCEISSIDRNEEGRRVGNGGISGGFQDQRAPEDWVRPAIRTQSPARE